ncbi:MAG TPA: DUF1302 domain-containing protein [Limnobacter sp.]|uniref:DUF1302 domain-containing protein n=1 Tax=Limnobacter sp. TaxID=2003368 RepID=UPI002E345A8A|nr:DUF1302 domain-containing protein [Limnobacter sp.]HEX5486088.1 DUF1302 domain-containing protein [Limnobacter sp.]
MRSKFWKAKPGHGFVRPVQFAVAVSAVVAVNAAMANEYQIGDYSLSVNSTVSVGTSVRMEAQDPRLYSSGNINSDGKAGTGQSNTGDDGNLNFGKGDAFSTIIKGVHDFDLKRENYGLFTRVKWFYDATLNNKGVFHGHEPNGYVPGAKLNDSGFNPYARFDGVNLLDAFGYVSTTVADKPLDIRLGRQVISWGESTLILSPISGLNTIDVSAFRRPGAELKEGFTPSEMLYGNLGLTDNTSLEAFYQLKWRKTVPEGCGTYFSTADFVSDGCSPLRFVAPDYNTPLVAGQMPVVNRALDRQPQNDGQFGLALRSYMPSVDTEFGAYAMNYHSRLPLASLKKGSNPNSTFGTGSDAAYVIDYPEDIAVFGLSFATNVGGWAWSGEASLAKDLPIQINATDLLRAGLTNGNTNAFAGAFGGATAPAALNSRVSGAAANTIVNGYDRFDVTQIQSTLIKTFDRALGSSQVVLVGEVGAVFVNGLPDVYNGGIRYGRSPVFGSGFNASKDGFVTPFSWGYRLRSAATYRNAIGEIDLIPSIAFSSDVRGYSPEPGQTFNQGRQSLGLGLGFEFDANTKAEINYVTFANKAQYDVLRDRDYLSISASYSF